MKQRVDACFPLALRASVGLKSSILWLYNTGVLGLVYIPCSAGNKGRQAFEASCGCNFKKHSHVGFCDTNRLVTWLTRDASYQFLLNAFRPTLVPHPFPMGSFLSAPSLDKPHTCGTRKRALLIRDTSISSISRTSEKSPNFLAGALALSFGGGVRLFFLNCHSWPRHLTHMLPENR